MKKLSIGIDDFKKIIDHDMYYVDKSLLIKDIIDIGSEVILITRPRRFGKTINMSMLKYFFEKGNKDYSYLFENLTINQKENYDYMKHHGKYPIIFISLKDAKGATWASTYEILKKIIASEYEKHSYLLKSNIFNETSKKLKIKRFEDIINLKASDVDYIAAIKELSEYLAKFHGENCIILIDEYDTPLQEGYLKGYYDEILNFMKSFLGSSLKGNLALEKGVLTGIMKIAKESIFSDFNNPSVATVLMPRFEDKFGFTKSEVKEMLNYYNLEEKEEIIEKWYNGYLFGNDQEIYNPWSILNYISLPAYGFKPYWNNTASKEMIKRVLQLDSVESKKTIENLLENKRVVKEISENIVYDNIEKDQTTAWSFLLHSGYLKVVKKIDENTRTKYELAIPNLEVALIYEDILKLYFEEDFKQSGEIKELINYLYIEDFENFSIFLKELYLKYVSYMDPNLSSYENIRMIEQKDRQENFHHGFILGLLMYSVNYYDVKSNREYGLGRPDIVLIPKDKDKKAFVFEFKWAGTKSSKTLDDLVKEGKDQIINKNYIEGIRLTEDVKTITALAFAFKGKNIKIEEI
jgi:hypothetical protein